MRQIGNGQGDLTVKLLSIMAAYMLVLSTSWAAEFVAPHPDLKPEEVVTIQLTALQTNNAERTDGGIEQTWIFAHPNNKRMTGPLPRFTQMVKGPQYNMLLNHHTHQIEEALLAESQVAFKVTVVSQNGDAYQCQWTVEKVAEGSQAGAWMTTAVTAPQRLGQAI
ncbi:MAG: DUF4864 domain-containing protein [Geminicoccaceae bacterium]